MNTNDLKSERIQLFKDAVMKEKTPKRVPYYGNNWSWKIYDAGYKLSEALFSYDIMEKVCRHMVETYNQDAYMDFGSRNPLQVTTILGNNEYIINDEANSININDQCFMDAREYDQLIANPKIYFWQKLLSRKYKILQKKENSNEFRKAIKAFVEFGQYNSKMAKIINEEYGIPFRSDSNFNIPWAGYEYLFNFLRGIKGLSYDIRRDLSKVITAIDTLEATYVDPAIERVAKLPNGMNENTCFDGTTVMLGHIILSTKQFEILYWPYLKKLAEILTNKNKGMAILVEGDSERFYDFFRDLPKGHFMLQTEQNDIFKMKKALPNTAIGGGMPVDLLGKGTKDQCIDYAKKLIEELGYDGGYVFSENKMLSFTYDCNSDNLKAVSDFVTQNSKLI